jgi:uncharacterized LabA/DUF88 family protein
MGVIIADTIASSYRRMMIFIDGENLVFNYQATLKNHSSNINHEVSHLQDIYVWHPKSFVPYKFEVLRASYYTFAVGTDDYIDSIRDDIKKLTFNKDSTSILPSLLRPYVFKKDKISRKSKGVDIQMTVDILTNVYNDNLDTVLLITGDGDFLPVINEIIRHGKQVYLASFKSGLNKKLINHVDEYIELDKIYFDI